MDIETIKSLYIGALLIGIGSFVIFIMFVISIADIIDMEEIEEGDSIGILYLLKLGIFFITGFGGGGLHAIINGETNVSVTVMYAVLYGVIFSAVYAVIIYGFSKLKKEDSISFEESIGNHAEVTVPIGKKGVGKILVRVGNTLREEEALSENGEAYKIGDTVIVSKVQGNTFIVKGEK